MQSMLEGQHMEVPRMNDFQRGETPTFVSHVKAGLDALAADNCGILIFSGGATKKSRTSLSEGQSYLVGKIRLPRSNNLAKENNFYQDQTADSTIDPTKIIVEEYATDSYQNLLFSLLRFRSHVGAYPRRVTVVTHAFKRERFLECHFPAVGLVPQTGTSPVESNDNATVIGINPPPDISPLESLRREGLVYGKKDLYGVAEDLSSKRAKRGWVPETRADLIASSGCDEVVAQLVCWDGGTGNQWFPRIEELPWYYGRSKNSH
ncbi:hypothetical protein N7468_009411 [Penicillium chermesinum]|uniref:DUF218 domain-containing protein n=1 Tax=Penicillium chermesinum TaxID=63820 RepID=A0A9W9NHZ4_9EURO|nr:uncharacterized protein N7468_009411 [Penicillium chermesinum]KAJ5220207.1 hypothetical protein N7468_009411 [Penicillium chermesinum]